ncbi:N6-Methyl-AMP deaminase-like [Glandiceps talaboti]
MDLAEFCRQLPKAELHAHLNGSIGEKTMTKLIESYAAKHKDSNDKIGYWMTTMKKEEQRTYTECFQMFGIIHQLVDNTDAVSMVTKDVIQDFRDDNILYLELRTTPRDEPCTGMTKMIYVETVVAAIKDCIENGVDIIIRLLLSIDRRVTVDVAMEIVQLADEFKASSNGIVVGVDLSGDPKVDSTHLIPALKEAKSRGLYVGVHVAEVPNMQDDKALLQLPPHRVGHGTFLHPEVGGNDELIELMKKHNLPLELCLTSNLMCHSVKSYEDHQFKFWYDMGHPITIGTDDKGVFVTSLSEEYKIAAETFDLDRQQLWNISYQSIDFICSNDQMKQNLREKWNELKKNLQFT